MSLITGIQLCYKQSLKYWKYQNNIKKYDFLEFYGTDVIIDKNEYIFTTAHKLTELTDFFYGKNILNPSNKLNVKYFNYDLDICILENDKFKSTNEYLVDLDFVEGEIFINKEHNIIIHFENIIESSINLGPNILFINCNKGKSNIEEGHSGLPLFNRDNKIIGLISRTYKSNVHLIPIINYIRFIENNKLCGFYEILNTKTNLVIIKKICNLYLNDKNKISDKFKINDKILKLNDKYILDSKIYDDRLKIFISIHSYVMYNFKIGDHIIFKVERDNKILDINIYCNSFEVSISNEFPTKFKKLSDNQIEYQLNYQNYIKNKKKKYPSNFFENITMDKIIIKEKI